MMIAPYIDATILKPDAVYSEYKTLCTDAENLGFAAVCVPPSMIAYCKNYISPQTKLATVAGFPNGYQLLSTKISEVNDLISAGADEIDFVINRSFLCNQEYDKIREETKSWIELCHEKDICSKWIIESSVLTNDKIHRLCDIANELKPSFVKTSTGVHGKAILENVQFLRTHLEMTIQIKAAGGISDKKTALQFIEAGATRLGVSQYLSILT